MISHAQPEVARSPKVRAMLEAVKVYSVNLAPHTLDDSLPVPLSAPLVNVL
jgi:hypothetical protein